MNALPCHKARHIPMEGITVTGKQQKQEANGLPHGSLSLSFTCMQPQMGHIELNSDPH